MKAPLGPLLQNEPAVYFNSSSNWKHTYAANCSVESLTRDVYTKGLHSHNDYWRKYPLIESLSYGVISVEADIWWFGQDYELERTEIPTTRTVQHDSKAGQHFKKDEIYVGHSQQYLQQSHTLFDLYLEPLYRLLSDANPKMIEGNNTVLDVDESSGVFYDFPEQLLYLWFDFKNNPVQAYKNLKTLLEPFIKKNWLSYKEKETQNYVQRPLTLIATGSYPLDVIAKEDKQYLFVDAPLQEFKSGGNETLMQEYSKLAVFASASLEQLLGQDGANAAKKDTLNSTSTKSLKDHIDVAHQHNLKTRVWDGIEWPNYLKVDFMRSLWLIGSDLINADDLKFASETF